MGERLKQTILGDIPGDPATGGKRQTSGKEKQL